MKNATFAMAEVLHYLGFDVIVNGDAMLLHVYNDDEYLYDLIINWSDV